MTKKFKKFKVTRKLALISGAAIIVVVAGGLGYWHYHNRPSQIVIGPAPAKNTGATSRSSSNQDGASSSSDKQAAPAGGFGSSGGKGSGLSSGQAPLTPSGTFISNHKPGQSNSPTTENSVCNTTPGANCYIKFTKGNTTLQLQAGVADSNGAIYWDSWNVNSYDFTSGQWQITAVATLNGQTATATDATPLSIQ